MGSTLTTKEHKLWIYACFSPSLTTWSYWTYEGVWSRDVFCLGVSQSEEMGRTRRAILDEIEVEGVRESLRREFGKQLWCEESWLKGERIYEVLMWSIVSAWYFKDWTSKINNFLIVFVFWSGFSQLWCCIKKLHHTNKLLAESSVQR